MSKTSIHSVPSVHENVDSAAPMGQAQTTPINEKANGGYAGSTHSSLRNRANEKADVHSEEEMTDTEPEEEHRIFGLKKARFTLLLHLVVGILFTAYFVAAMVLHTSGSEVSSSNGPISILIVIYAFTLLYLINCHLPEGFFARPADGTWKAVAKATHAVPDLARKIVGYAIFPIAIILTAVVPGDSEHATRTQRLVSLLGLVFYLLVMFVTSRNRRLIHWPTVATGIGLQYMLGLFVIKTSLGQTIFTYIGTAMASFLAFSSAGINFVVGDAFTKQFGSFATGVLPAIIFFGAVIQIMYYYNIIQTAIGAIGRVVIYFFDVSGVEMAAAIAAPFVGMSESAMLVGPYLEHATNAEIHQVMASGFATISGSVYLGLISFNAEPVHLITCCIMSVPCAIVTSKMRYPEEEVPLTKGKAIKLERPDEEDSFFHALANGSILGMQLCIVISAVLVGFLSLLACANYLLNWIFLFLGAQGVTLERILGWVVFPFAWLMGVPTGELEAASTIIGVKFVLNEFVAFAQAKEMIANGVFSARGKLLMTFACCSFANPSSLGSQISLLGKMAPTRAGDVARVALSALCAGAMSTILSACIAGIVM
ncbi:hypothetical protein DFQ27_002151 [Actinomortierella ambigua]|uniref:Uncharacterized protein n=1 Tax=Actinomortierella ambigua TaxID=1343610 RepID=A0A9P6QA88_9FUNG|nr:hypothetical protein DFQ27_002151 [Actinomortierella ambigua]